MSDWADFCEMVGIDMNDPDQFDAWLDSSADEQWVLTKRFTPAQLQHVGAANPYCSRCGGSGYIGRYRHVENGRCFRCFPG